MIEDKLSTDQRIRLEALNQATQRSVGNFTISDEVILHRAAAFEGYIRNGQPVPS